MARKIGIFVDVSNIYYCINKKFGTSNKLDYKKFYDYVKSFGEIQQATAYGLQSRHQAIPFIACLKDTGFNTKYMEPDAKKRNSWNVGIAIDIVQSIDKLDMIILSSSDNNLQPAVSWALNKGVDVIVLATGISRELKDSASRFIEIPESMLEERVKDENSNNLGRDS